MIAITLLSLDEYYTIARQIIRAAESDISRPYIDDPVTDMATVGRGFALENDGNFVQDGVFAAMNVGQLAIFLNAPNETTLRAIELDYVRQLREAFKSNHTTGTLRAAVDAIMLERSQKTEFASYAVITSRTSFTMSTGEIDAIQREQREALRRREEPEVVKIRQLELLRGVGPVSSSILVGEFFGWRDFKNGRQVGSLAGLTPTPYDSGTSRKEQGISKAGNRHVRGIAIELAWSWLRHQEESELSRWFLERFGGAGKRARKVGIVALARRLLIALWRFLETGALPEGAELKATA